MSAFSLNDKIAKNDARFKEAKRLLGQGKSLNEALKTTGLAVGAYYVRHRAEKKAKPVKAAKAKTPRKLLNVTDLPDFVPQIGNLFMVYGSPAMLASFAKGMS